MSKKKKQSEEKPAEVLICEDCAVSSADDNSVQKRECGHFLCEECMPCMLCDDLDFDSESDTEFDDEEDDEDEP